MPVNARFMPSCGLFSTDFPLSLCIKTILSLGKAHSEIHSICKGNQIGFLTVTFLSTLG